MNIYIYIATIILAKIQVKFDDTNLFLPFFSLCKTSV